MKRYSLNKFGILMKKIDSNFQIDDKELFLPNYNIHPGNIVPIIKYDAEKSSFPIDRSTWGYKKPPYFFREFLDTKGFYARKVKRKVRRLASETLIYVNFTFESINTSKQINKLYHNIFRRCLIPATSYFKWEHEVVKWEADDQKGYYQTSPHLFYSKTEEIYFFIGFTFKSETGKGHAIITTIAPKPLQKFGKSSPIVLNFNDAKIWLREKDPKKEVSKLYKKFRKSFTYYKVSKSVNKQNINNQKCIQPI